MHLQVAATDEIYRVVIRVAAQEYEEIVDAVGNLEVQHLLVKLRCFSGIVHDPRNVAELERADTDRLQMFAEITPFLEQRDRRALVVLERQYLPDAGNGVVAQFA